MIMVDYSLLQWLRLVTVGYGLLRLVTVVHAGNAEATSFASDSMSLTGGSLVGGDHKHGCYAGSCPAVKAFSNRLEVHRVVYHLVGKPYVVQGLHLCTAVKTSGCNEAVHLSFCKEWACSSSVQSICKT